VLAFPLYHLIRVLPPTSLALHSSLPARPAIPQVACSSSHLCCSWGGGWQGGSLHGYLHAMAPAEHVPTPPPAASSRATGITARVQLWVVQPVQVHAELVAHPSGAVRSHGQLDGHLVSVRLQHTSLNDAPPAAIHSSRGSCPTLEVVVDAVQVAPLTLTHPAR
jgi:hypothetical protein